MDPADLRELERATAAGDHAAGLRHCLALASAGRGQGTAGLALRFLASRLVSLPDAERPAVLRRALQELRAACGEQALDDEAALVADLLLASGLRQDATELLRRAYQKRPTGALAHRLGLCELALAMRSPAADAATAAARWGRTLAYLTAAAADRRYYLDWAERRAATYGAAVEAAHEEESQGRIHEQLGRLLLASAEQAERASHRPTGEALRSLAADLEADRAGTAALAEALDLLGPVAGAPDGVPLPFGLLWYRALGGPEAARDVLAAAVVATLDVPAAGPGAADPAAPTLGRQLRQWYSRLSPVRHALRLGQADVARRHLTELCSQEDGCRLNPRPALPRVAASPSCCDPACPYFARCNPGYAGLPDPARAMEEDAHRLAIQASLALAGYCAGLRPPRLAEAAEEWVRGRGLATVLGEAEAFAEAVLDQVLWLLDKAWREPELATPLLERALVAVPSATLKGRLADRLTDRGIARFNGGQLEEGAQDLRWAVRLNRYSGRAWLNLCVMLQGLALRHFNDGDVARAAQTAAELHEVAGQALHLGGDAAEIGKRRDWAQEQAASWKALAALDDDPLAFLRELTDEEGSAPPPEGEGP